ncbi:MAG TPA: class I SAM-dependent methyltransferase [Nitrosopumilaceae archaeon]|nr:class I SAM-dependent methyltransferase [Nitrosopumilaceae archaeon]
MALSEEELEIEDFGAGSKHFTSNKRKVKDIVKHGISQEKYARLLFRLVNYFNPGYIIELGTSIGLTTMYLASSSTKHQIYTIEACKNISSFSRQLFSTHRYENIRLINNTFEQALPVLLQELNSVPMLYIDGNHIKQATLNYFNLALEKKDNDSVFIFDDIHWSNGMEEAWKTIIEHPEVTLSIDMFYIGLVFFRKEQKQKEHFVIRY